jgi:hypothetical protein
LRRQKFGQNASQASVDRAAEHAWTWAISMIALLALNTPVQRRSLLRPAALTACALLALVALLCGAVSVSRRETRSELTARLQRLRQRFATVEKTLHLPAVSPSQSIEARQVAAAVIARFIPYVQEDLDHEELTRAARELSAIEQMTARLAHAKNPGAMAMITHTYDASAPPGRRLSVKDGEIVVADKADAGHDEPRPVFLAGYGEFQQIRDDVEQLPAAGANLIQIEIYPGDIFPKPDVVDTKPVDALVSVLDRAAKAGVAVDVQLSPHAMPSWVLEREPALRKRRDGFVQYCIHDPVGRDLLQRHVQTVIGAIKNHPALLSVCLANEPGNIEEPCEFAKRSWRTWLRKGHGNVEAFNRSHNTHVRSFDDVPLPNPFEPPKDRIIWSDYIRFNEEQEVGWLEMLATAVHGVAPDLPVHVKTLSILPEGSPFAPENGNDPTLIAGLSNLNGNDGYNLFQYGKSDFAESWQQNEMGHDLQKSLNPAPVFNSENHVLLDRESRDVPPAHVRAALWQGAVHGQAATSIWVWQRSYDRKSDFWGGVLERPDAVEAVGLTNIDLNRVAPELRTLQSEPSDVTILSSTSALTWDPQVPAVTAALYTALSFTGLKVGFLTERQLESGIKPSTPIVFVPGIVHISPLALRPLVEYRGRILFMGSDRLLSRDDHDHPTTLKIPAEVLGDTHADSWRLLWEELTVALTRWQVSSPVQLRDSHGKAIWGVEWRSAHDTTGELIVNLCNFRHDSVKVQLVREGRIAKGTDLLSGLPLQPTTVLQSLETKIVRLN